MGSAYFYQLKDSPLEATLPMLVGKARSAGWRVLVRGQDPALIKRLDELFWQGADDGFMPHGVAGGAHDADQPVLIGDVPSDGFGCLMSVAGAAVSDAEVNAMERVCILFDGEELELTRYEFRLMRLFLTNPGRVFSRGQLMDQVWEEPDCSLERTVDAHIKQLRAKLRDRGQSEDSIRTHRGLGYSFDPHS